MILRQNLLIIFLLRTVCPVQCTVHTTLGLVTLTSACDHILQGDLPINKTYTTKEVTFDVKQH